MIPTALIHFTDGDQFEYAAYHSYACDVFEDMTRNETIVEVHDQAMATLQALGEKTPIKRVIITSYANGIRLAWYSKTNPNKYRVFA